MSISGHPAVLGRFKQRETQVKWQVFISLMTKQLNSTTSAPEFYHIKQLAECGVCTFFLNIVSTRFEIILKQLVNTKKLRSFENEVRPA